MSVEPTPITRIPLEHRRRRAQRVFPELRAVPDADYAALSVYADRCPERFLDLAAKADALKILQAEAADPGGLLGSFLRDHRTELDVAFRSLLEINRHGNHDQPWPEFNDLAQLEVIDREINPSYLKLAEAVLSTFLLPIAMREKRLRGKPTAKISFYQRVDEAYRTALRRHLTSYDRVLRNAIAHGSVVYCQHEIIYQDRSASRSLSAREMAQAFDSLLDTCNGLAAAYRCFYLIEQAFVQANSLAPPLQMLVDEVRAQAEAPSWTLAGALEMAAPGTGRQLNLIIHNRFLDDTKTYYYCMVTAAAAERFLPGFERYFLSVRGRALSGGWAVFDGIRLAVLRTSGNTDPAQVSTAAMEGGVMLFPPFLKRWLRIPRAIRPIGSLIEVVRATWRVTRSKLWVIAGVHVKPRYLKMHRKQYYAAIESYFALEVGSVDEAIKFVRSHARTLIWIASLSVRWRNLFRSTAVLLPLGYCTVNVFLSDFRTRRLVGYGLGNQLLCRLTLKRFGQVQIVPLATSIPENVQGCRIDWNSKAVERAQLGL